MTVFARVIGTGVAMSVIAILAGCTSLVERQILNMEPVSGMASVEFAVAPNRQKVCSATVEHRCLHYLDLADVQAIYDEGQMTHEEFKWTLTLRNSREPELSEYFSEETLFRLPELADDAPVVIVAPGYGMKSAHLFAPTGVWLRSLGFRPLIIAGPTETNPMAFGLPNLTLIRDHVINNYGDAPVVLMGFSMGMMATTELERLFIDKDVQPSGLVFVAPMNDFRSDANFMFQQLKEMDWRLRWFVSDSRFDAALGNIITRSGETERMTTLAQRLEATQSPALVLAGRTDEVVDLQVSRKAVERWLGVENLQVLNEYPEVDTDLPVTVTMPNPDIERFKVFQIEQGNKRYLEYELLGHTSMVAMLKPIRGHIEEWLQQFVEIREAPPELEVPEVM
ncbi:MAG: alpha/beta hydrolase [Aliidiomarina sp.]|uniref:hypothetical protein n=1 Tax=Aliidiomarina sp. TaxID=1872439 RepID=UPI0025BAAD5E|nr:hypothetical protein [Aliidiomarina sp.]MCH8500983.1 alpha/beta hydrolase [Aliidiomarina sp.]